MAYRRCFHFSSSIKPCVDNIVKRTEFKLHIGWFLQQCIVGSVNYHSAVAEITSSFQFTSISKWIFSLWSFDFIVLLAQFKILLFLYYGWQFSLTFLTSSIAKVSIFLPWDFFLDSSSKRFKWWVLDFSMEKWKVFY